ncbi:MAG: esterase/lipase family protein [Stenotrophomonas sp.]
MNEPVLVLHGIWNPGSWMLPLVWRLRQAGIDARPFAYDSIAGGPERAVPALVERIGQTGAGGLVGYSLGGLVALQALRAQPGLPVRRLVCVGSPLCGSQTARQLQQLRLGAVLGRSGHFLAQGQPDWQGPVRIGQVAGNCARGVGRLLGAQDSQSDGTVGLAETRWPGLADHCVVASSHTGLPFSARVAGQVAHFLRTGGFSRGGQGIA